MTQAEANQQIAQLRDMGLTVHDVIAEHVPYNRTHEIISLWIWLGCTAIALVVCFM